MPDIYDLCLEESQSYGLAIDADVYDLVLIDDETDLVITDSFGSAGTDTVVYDLIISDDPQFGYDTNDVYDLSLEDVSIGSHKTSHSTVIDLLFEGPAGRRGRIGDKGDKGNKGDTGDLGPVGPPGSPVELTGIAGRQIGGHKCLVQNNAGRFIYADSTNIGHLNRKLYLSRSAVNNGAIGTFLSFGRHSDPSWSWSPGRPIYLATEGHLRHDVPGEALFILQVAMALTDTEIMFDPQMPLIREGSLNIGGYADGYSGGYSDGGTAELESGYSNGYFGGFGQYGYGSYVAGYAGE